MLIYRGGQRTGKGTYWDMTNGRRVDVLNEGMLPGERRSIFLRLSPFAMIFLVPILGLLYVVFLPAAGVFLTLALFARKLGRWLFDQIRRLVHFEWRMSEAYFSGKKKYKKKGPDPEEGPRSR